MEKSLWILTEMVANSDGIEAVICGIGINMNHLPEDFHGELQSKATSLRIHANQKYIVIIY